MVFCPRHLSLILFIIIRVTLTLIFTLWRQLGLPAKVLIIIIADRGFLSTSLVTRSHHIRQVTVTFIFTAIWHQVVITIIDMVFCPRHLSVIIRETLTLIFTLWHQRRPQVAIIITYHGQSFSSITLTLPFTRWRHIAQLRRAGAHCAQQTRWPQGRKRMLTSFTWQILQVLSWPISWFSPSRSETRMWTTVSFEQLSLSAFLLQLEYYHH